MPELLEQLRIRYTVISGAASIAATTGARRNRLFCRRSQRAAFAAVFSGLILFVLAQAGFHLAVLNEWLPVQDPVFMEKWDVLAKHALVNDSSQSLCRVLALGSSRTQLAFDAQEFSRRQGENVVAFNFGCPAAGPMTSALYLRRLLGKGVRPDVLFVEYHPGFVSDYDPPFEGQWLHAYRLKESEPELLRQFGHMIPTPEHHCWRGYVTSFTAFRMALLNTYWPTMLACPYGLTVGVRGDAHGFVPGINLATHLRPKAIQRSHQQYAPVFANYRAGGCGERALRDMLSLCQQHGIRPILLIPPESTEFRSWYGPAGNHSILALATKLRDEFSITLLDARGWVADDAFADGHHLTPEGARIFTARLAQEFPQP